jgi:hypothetical protein
MRNLILAKSAYKQAWACSECAWEFDDSGPPEGDSIDEMARNYERKRDQEFKAHVCSQHPKGQNKALRIPGK